MNRLLVIIFMSICSILTAQSELRSNVKGAVFYRDGATVTRSVQIKLNKGRNEVMIGGLPLDLDQATTELGIDGKVLILSNKYERDFLNTADLESKYSSILQTLRDSLNLLAGHSEIIIGQKYILNQNRELSLEGESSVATIRQLSDSYADQMKRLNNDLFHIDLKRRSINERIVKLQKQEEADNKKLSQGSTKLRLILDATAAGAYDFTMSYFTHLAGWMPAYELRYRSVDSPLEVIYKADIFQQTGEDWTNVQITLSTDEPTTDLSYPVLWPYFLTFNNYYRSNQNQVKNSSFAGNTIRGVVLDDSGEPLIGANVVIKGSLQGTVTDLEGAFELQGFQNGNTLEVSFMGYESVEIVPTAGYEVIRLASGQLLDEVVVTGYSKSKLEGRTAGVAIRGANSVASRGENIAPIAINKFQSAREYILDQNYDLASLARPHTVLFQQRSVSAEYHYLTVPKLAERVYLVSTIKDWEDLDLLDGETSIYVEDRYVGNTLLTEQVDEQGQLVISLGDDDDIRVKRIAKKEFQKKRFLGANIEEQKSWEIEIENTKSSPIELAIYDQYPISQDSDIKVDIEELSDGEINKDTGEVLWKKSIGSKEKKSLLLRYKVKYPKDRKIIID